MSEPKTFKCWAIKLKCGRLAGRYYFPPFCMPAPQHKGCLTALFETREDARKMLLRSVGTTGVVRVVVTIEEQKP